MIHLFFNIKADITFVFVQIEHLLKLPYDEKLKREYLKENRLLLKDFYA